MAKIANKEILFAEKSVRFTFADGTVRTIGLGEMQDDIITHLALHGLSQKCGDSYSGAESVGEAKEKFNSTADQLMAGDWNIARSATGGIWVDALAAAGDVERDEALEKWNSMSDEEKKAVRAHPAIKAAKAKIELQRAQAKAEAAGEGGAIDLDDL